MKTFQRLLFSVMIFLQQRGSASEMSLSFDDEELVLNCLECHEVTSPELCETWVKCGLNELCYTRQFQNHRGDLAYHMGCQDKQTCDIYSHTNELVAILGKRSETGASHQMMCKKCCQHDDCNTKLCVDRGTTDVKNATCYPPYQSFTNRCYYVSNIAVNWDDARSLCYNLNSQLVSINSEAEQNFLTLILQDRNNLSQPDAFWTGGMFNRTRNVYQWVDGTVANYTAWGPFQPIHHTDANHYRIDVKNPLKHPPYVGWTWAFDDHLNKAGFICEMDEQIIN